MDRKDYEQEHAVKNGREAFDAVTEALERALREVRKYSEWYDQADNNKERADTLQYTIGYVTSNILGNMRIDLLAARQAELHKLTK